MSELPLEDRTALITGSGQRIRSALARACAQAGANLVIHYHHSEKQALELREELASM